MASCSIASAAWSTARSVSSPRGRAETRPSRNPRTGAATPAARASRHRASRRPSGALTRPAVSATALLRLDPEVDHRQVPRQLDQVTRQPIDGDRVADGRQALGVRVDQRLLRPAQGGEREQVARLGAEGPAPGKPDPPPELLTVAPLPP